MTMYAVSSVGIYRDKYTPITNPDGTMKVQNVIVDTNTEELFSDCDTIFQIENKYEMFWNRLNYDYRNSEIVKVVKVEELSDKYLKLVK